jgi:7-cyano-7-deazaguanine synthase
VLSISLEAVVVRRPFHAQAIPVASAAKEQITCSIEGSFFMSSFGVSLLSGGLDSTVVTAYARNDVDHLTALTFHYSNSQGREVYSAREVAARLGVEQQLVDISFFEQVAWYSAVTNPEQFPVPQDRSNDEIGVGIPITYVPLRNTVFLALAAAYAESKVLHGIEVEGHDPQQVGAVIYLAANAVDYSGYPDCRPEYYEKCRDALAYGSKMWSQYNVPIQIKTPIIELSKADIVRLGMTLGAPLEYSWSCYRSGDLPCGACDSCILRAKGFSEAGVADPLLQRLAPA